LEVTKGSDRAAHGCSRHFSFDADMFGREISTIRSTEGAINAADSPQQSDSIGHHLDPTLPNALRHVLNGLNKRFEMRFASRDGERGDLCGQLATDLLLDNAEGWLTGESPRPGVCRRRQIGCSAQGVDLSARICPDPTLRS
jgi:hypothetical protein